MSLSLPTYIYSTSIAVTTTTTITTTTTTITFTLYLTSIFYQSFSQLRQVPKEDTCISFCTSLKYVIINVFQQYKCCNVINMLEITSIKCEIIYHPSLKSLGPFFRTRNCALWNTSTNCNCARYRFTDPDFKKFTGKERDG